MAWETIRSLLSLFCLIIQQSWINIMHHPFEHQQHKSDKHEGQNIDMALSHNKVNIEKKYRCFKSGKNNRKRNRYFRSKTLLQNWKKVCRSKDSWTEDRDRGMDWTKNISAMASWGIDDSNNYWAVRKRKQRDIKWVKCRLELLLKPETKRILNKSGSILKRERQSWYYK